MNEKSIDFIYIFIIYFDSNSIFFTWETLLLEIIG